MGADDGGRGFAAGAAAKETAPADVDAGFVVIGVTVTLPRLNGLATAAAETGAGLAVFFASGAGLDATADGAGESF